MASLALNIITDFYPNKLALERLPGDVVAVTATKSMRKPLTVLYHRLGENKR